MEHEKYMARCIELAKNGLGTTYPNPLVGSLVLFDGKIIGEGWHKKAGEPHAEVLAIESVKDKTLLEHSTLYVNLEPCSHFGKTPPCADLVIDSKIPRVVIGNTDPNPLVAGRGIARLKAAGIDVVDRVLDAECRELNRRFFTFHEKRRPFVILKWAQSADGFFAPEKHSGPHWISGKRSRQLVHKMRSQEQSILIGTNTALIDNPALDVRDWTGINPIRIVIDRNLKIPSENHIFEKSGEVIVFSDKHDENRIASETIDFSGDVPRQVLSRLHELGIQSVIVEGGAFTIAGFIESQLWDEAHIFCAGKLLNAGIPAPRVTGASVSKTTVADDELLIFRR